MNSLQNVSLTICYICIAVSILSVLIPQKRTRRIMGFVLGIFFVGTLATAAAAELTNIDLHVPEADELTVPTYSESDYTAAVAQLTADRVTEALDELLQNEGIHARDIQLTMKISDEGRISVVRAVIYMSESESDRVTDTESIVYRNLSKEPEIYVTGEETQ